MTTLSELTPIIGWSSSVAVALVRTKTFQFAVGSELSETAMYTWLSFVAVNARPERNHLPLSASYRILGSENR